jgi:hypothetical protein
MLQVNTIGFEEKKILVRSDQANTTKGKNVIVSDQMRNWMLKPRSPEIGVWKENMVRKLVRKIKPTSSMLIEKYARQQQQLAGVRHQGGSLRHWYAEARRWVEDIIEAWGLRES